MGRRKMSNAPIKNDIRLLLDENISPNIAPRLWDNGIDAVPIRDRSMLRATDYKIVQLAQNEDRAVATINEWHFERLVMKMARHCGIAVIPSGGSRDEQFEYVMAIAKFWLASQNAMVAARNSITAVDEDMRVTSRFVYQAQPASVVRIGLPPA
jgi:predicted nuclease of predicted toxin-antitoxin system